MAFAKPLIEEAHVAASPRVVFREHGEGLMGIGLVESEPPIRQATRA